MSNLVRYKPAASSLTGAKKRVSVEEVRAKYQRLQETETWISLLFDATGSMSPYWAEVKRTIGQIVKRTLSAAQNVTMKIVAYRDDCDEKILESSPWAKRAEDLSAFLDTVSCYGGGDVPEAVDRALQLALEEQALTRIILIGDAPPHEQRDCTKEAEGLGQKSRPVYPIVIGQSEETRRAFERIARLSGGKVVPLTNIDELFDFIVILSVHAAGANALSKYREQYQDALTEGGRRLLLTLLK